MKKSIFSALCFVLLATTTQNAWGAEELASWTFSSGTAGTNYPSNKTNFTATSGSCSNSTFYLNGTGSTWNDTKGWAFTAVTDIQITIKAASNITQGSVLTFKVTTFYNKASNAPMTGFSLTCKESTGSFGTTGLSTTSWSLSTSSAEYSVTYTTQNNIVKDNTIVLKLTQTGKAGAGQGFMGPIVVTMESGTSSTTLYFGQEMELFWNPARRFAVFGTPPVASLLVPFKRGQCFFLRAEAILLCGLPFLRGVPVGRRVWNFNFVRKTSRFLGPHPSLRSPSP